ASKLNWSGLNTTADSLPLPHLGVIAATDLHVAGTATVALAGLFTATGAGALDVGQGSGGGAAPAFTNAQVTALTLDTSVAAGGVGSASASLKLVSISQGTKSWLGVDASGISLSFAVDPLTLSLANGQLQLNRASGGASKLNWSGLNTTTDSLPLPHLGVIAATDLHVAGTATLALAGLFTATGTGSLDVGQVSDGAAAPALTNAQPTALTLDTSVAAGGVGGLSASLKLVSIRQGTKSWLGVDASALHLSELVDPLTLSLSNGVLQLNRASGGASK